MAKTIFKDRFDTWTIDGDNDTWTLAKQARIDVDDEAGIEVLATSTGNRLNINGHISATNGSGVGIRVDGADTRIVMGNQSLIEGNRGIDANEAGFRLVNKGEIDVDVYGVTSNETANIRNSGEISAEYGVVTSDTSRVVNLKNGEIHGADTGVSMTGGTLVNHGLISGSDYAVFFTAEGRFINTGTIEGDVQLSSGDDVFNTVKGKFYGDVDGGDGGDTYKIGKNNVDIVEDIDDGYDKVYSSASHTLTDHVEMLRLVGKQDIDGEGNGESNFMTGNKGDNRLEGAGGGDTLDGGAGKDMLIGGSGDDFFWYSHGDGKDTVADFTKGEDILWLTGFDGVDSFEELQSHISQHGEDTWISMGQGNRLVIRDVDAQDLEADDFSFLEFAT